MDLDEENSYAYEIFLRFSVCRLSKTMGVPIGFAHLVCWNLIPPIMHFRIQGFNKFCTGLNSHLFSFGLSAHLQSRVHSERSSRGESHSWSSEEKGCDSELHGFRFDFSRRRRNNDLCLLPPQEKKLKEKNPFSWLVIDRSTLFSRMWYEKHVVAGTVAEGVRCFIISKGSAYVGGGIG